METTTEAMSEQQEMKGANFSGSEQQETKGPNFQKSAKCDECFPSKCLYAGCRK